MKIIKQLSEYMKEELQDAKKYAKDAIHYKTENPSLAKTFYEISNQEINHADMLHTEVVKIIDKQRQIETPPAIMMELWEDEHKDYIEDVVHVKYMLSLYSK